MRMLTVLVALVATVSLARADSTPPVEFGGERYTVNFQDQATQVNGEPGEGLAEFTLAGETVEDWSKLFAYHWYPYVADDPVAAAQMLGKVVKENNKDANYAVIEDEKTGEAIIDFLTWTPDSDVMEFNVFRYARAADGKGLIAVQYAQHIKLGELDVEGMRALRSRSVEDMAATDISQARRYFVSKLAKSADAGKAEQPMLARAGRSE
jgi:hypothetical protein